MEARVGREVVGRRVIVAVVTCYVCLVGEHRELYASGLDIVGRSHSCEVTSPEVRSNAKPRLSGMPKRSQRHIATRNTSCKAQTGRVPAGQGGLTSGRRRKTLGSKRRYCSTWSGMYIALCTRRSAHPSLSRKRKDV